MQDRDAAAEVVAQACIKVPGPKKLYADGAYAIEQAHSISVEVVRHPGNRSTGTWQDGSAALVAGDRRQGLRGASQAKRWVVERTHA